MSANYLRYRNRIRNDPNLRQVLSALPESLAVLLNERTVLAMRMSERFRVSVRKGPIKQAGQTRTQFEYYDEGEAGDYLVLAGEQQVAVPKGMFEKVFVVDEEVTP